MKILNSNFLLYFIILIPSLMIINLLSLNNIVNVIEVYEKSIKKLVTKTIIEYDEIDLSHLCMITQCVEIEVNSNHFKIVNNILMANPHNNPVIIFDNIITDDFYTIIKIDEYNMEILTDTSDMINLLLKGSVNINIIFIIFFTIFFSVLVYNKKKRTLLNLMETSNSLREKNMQILTENIHHELNTPIAIIAGAIRQYEIDINATWEKGMCDKDGKIILDYSQIYTALEQVYTVLHRMSNFKDLKYSNGNKTLWNILEYSANSMSIYKKSNFNIELDQKLKNYSMSSGLKNGDLLNIVSNHFRNSLEANSTKILIQFKFDSSKNIGRLFIIDNGAGLRDPNSGLMLHPENFQDIFKPYYSSKSTDGKSKINESTNIIKNIFTIIFYKIINTFKQNPSTSTRGVGLYLNRELLRENGGDLKIRETSSNGTVFEIIFKCKLKKGLI